MHVCVCVCVWGGFAFIGYVLICPSGRGAGFPPGWSSGFSSAWWTSSGPASPSASPRSEAAPPGSQLDGHTNTERKEGRVKDRKEMKERNERKDTEERKTKVKADRKQENILNFMFMPIYFTTDHQRIDLKVLSSIHDLVGGYDIWDQNQALCSWSYFARKSIPKGKNGLKDGEINNTACLANNQLYLSVW